MRSCAAVRFHVCAYPLAKLVIAFRTYDIRRSFSRRDPRRHCSRCLLSLTSGPSLPARVFATENVCAELWPGHRNGSNRILRHKACGDELLLLNPGTFLYMAARAGSTRAALRIRWA